MLLIEKGKRSALPTKFRPINNTCAYLYDELMDLLKSEGYMSLKVTRVLHEVEPSDSEVQNSNCLDWLKKNNREREFKEAMTKTLAFAVMGDMANFIYEAISAAQKGKMSVAYALLRKPFTDELLLLEQLLVQPDTFIEEFYNNTDVSKYNPVKFPGKSKEGEKRIIESCVNKINSQFYDSELVFKLRYDATFETGILGASHKALHIVTNGSGYETQIQNLNFIFSSKEDIDVQWKHFYFVTPYLLIYTLEVIDTLFKNYSTGEEEKAGMERRRAKRFFGYIHWLKQSNWNKDQTIVKLNRDLKSLLDHKCSVCNGMNRFTDADIDLFFEMELIICKHCFQPFSII